MKKTYTGSCHCGKIRFEVDAKIDHVRVCDCSICAKRGALILRVDEKDFHLKTPLKELTLYQWGRKTAKVISVQFAVFYPSDVQGSLPKKSF